MHVVVKRFQPFKKLYPHELALTIAFLSVLSFLLLETLIGLTSVDTAQLGPVYRLIFFLIFAAGTYLGGLFVLAILLIGLVTLLAGTEYSPAFWPTLQMLCLWYLIGYLFGYILGWIYDALVFLILKIKRRFSVSFIYDDEKAVNIIKSPFEQELAIFTNTRADFSQEWLYQYDLNTQPKKPYTILFVANPKLRTGNNTFRTDPILENPDLFYRMVDMALGSFDTNEVLGRPEIWSRVRILTIFPEELKKENYNSEEYNLVDGLRMHATIGDEIVENLIAPQSGMVERLKNIINNDLHIDDRIIKDLFNLNGDAEANPLENVDVIFCLSASPDYIRATSFFTDFPENYSMFGTNTSGAPPEVRTSQVGETFTIEVLPERHAESILKPHISETTLYHEYQPIVPGHVAINVLTAGRKTFIHEFAHVMSSAKYGAIVDEYADEFNLLEINPENRNDGDRFAINCLQRIPQTDKYISTPKHFLKFNNIEYYSDLDHPSAEENWISYFPERFNPDVICTMDSGYGRYRFDKLICAFMYDRLNCIMNRP